MSLDLIEMIARVVDPDAHWNAKSRDAEVRAARERRQAIALNRASKILDLVRSDQTRKS